ncbi:hypothetical protein MMC15_001939 [Xylographa vitiligo]|nr:hypothetical protein [Xylographa vitiligo]
MNRILFNNLNRRVWIQRPLLEMVEQGDSLQVFALSELLCSPQLAGLWTPLKLYCRTKSIIASTKILNPSTAKRDDLLRSAGHLIFNHIKNTDRVPYTNSIFSQVCRWIWDSQTVADNITQYHKSYPDAATQRLVHYSLHDGITEDGMFEVLQNLNIFSIIESKADMNTNLIAIARTSDDLIGDWQSRHLTTTQLSAVQQSALRLDERLKKDHEQRAFNYRRNMTEEQYDHY